MPFAVLLWKHLSCDHPSYIEWRIGHPFPKPRRRVLLKCRCRVPSTALFYAMSNNLDWKNLLFGSHFIRRSQRYPSCLSVGSDLGNGSYTASSVWLCNCVLWIGLVQEWWD